MTATPSDYTLTYEELEGGNIEGIMKSMSTSSSPPIGKASIRGTKDIEFEDGGGAVFAKVTNDTFSFPSSGGYANGDPVTEWIEGSVRDGSGQDSAPTKWYARYFLTLSFPIQLMVDTTGTGVTKILRSMNGRRTMGVSLWVPLSLSAAAVV